MLDISIFSSYANVDSEDIDKLDYFKIINKYFIKRFSLLKKSFQN